LQDRGDEYAIDLIIQNIEQHEKTFEVSLNNLENKDYDGIKYRKKLVKYELSKEEQKVLDETTDRKKIQKLNNDNRENNKDAEDNISQMFKELTDGKHVHSQISNVLIFDKDREDNSS
jgi:hypothetical protein